MLAVTYREPPQVAEPVVATLEDLRQRIWRMCYDRKAEHHDLEPNQFPLLAAKWGVNIFWDELASAAAPQLDEIEKIFPFSHRAAIKAAAALPDATKDTVLAAAKGLPPALAALKAAAAAAAEAAPAPAAAAAEAAPAPAAPVAAEPEVPAQAETQAHAGPAVPASVSKAAAATAAAADIAAAESILTAAVSALLPEQGPEALTAARKIILAALTAVLQSAICPRDIVDAVQKLKPGAAHPALTAASREAAAPGATPASVAAAVLATLVGHDIGLPAAISVLQDTDSQKVHRVLKALADAAVEVMPAADSLRQLLLHPTASPAVVGYTAAVEEAVAEVTAACRVLDAVKASVEPMLAKKLGATAETVGRELLQALDEAAGEAAAAIVGHARRYDRIIDNTQDLLQAAIKYLVVIEPLNYAWHLDHHLRQRQVPGYADGLIKRPQRSLFVERVLARHMGWASSGVLTAGWRQKLAPLYQKFYTKLALHDRFVETAGMAVN